MEFPANELEGDDTVLGDDRFVLGDHTPMGDSTPMGDNLGSSGDADGFSGDNLGTSGDADGFSGDPAAITSLTYAEPVAIYLTSSVIDDNVPTFLGGTASSYAITPPLPAGLTIDTTTGVLSGLPSAATAPADYTVTAVSSSGNASTTIRITVKGAPYFGLTIASTAAFTGGWTTADADSGSGQTADGRLSSPQGIAVDESHDLFYVANASAHRIDRYVLSTGAYAGWIGKVAGVSPTGGAAGCTTATQGTPTPGWCVGGLSTYSQIGDGGLDAPTSIALDLSNDRLYVSEDGANITGEVFSPTVRISRFVASTGEFRGWVGEVGATLPTSGAQCPGPTTGSFTPGWCMGGTTGQGSLNADFTGFSNFGGIEVDIIGGLERRAFQPDYFKEIKRLTLSSALLIAP